MNTPRPPLDTVAIVGRPNVGKSALFNRLIGREISIVHDMPGVTRDRIAAECRKGDKAFTLVDTGGICGTLDDGLQERIRYEAQIALETSCLVVLVVDGQEGLSPIDREIAALLRKSGRPVLLVVNKIDESVHDTLEGEFTQLGFHPVFRVSAAHGRGIERLRDAIEAGIPERPAHDEANPEVVEKRPIRLALLGRPNVGKSSLINAILQDERTIVSEIAGTTRDSVDIPYERGGQAYQLIDTAGIRRQSRLDTRVEVFSVRKSLSSIKRADICALVVDARGVTAQDRKIAGNILRENKPCFIIANKFDLYHPDAKEKDRIALLTEDIRRELFFLHYAPLVIASAKENQYLNKVFGSVEAIRDAARNEPGTGVINRVMQKALLTAPPPQTAGRRFNLLYATKKPADRVRPVEAFHLLLFANRTNLLGDTYKRYLENKLNRGQEGLLRFRPLQGIQARPARDRL
jgi:GTPase